MQKKKFFIYSVWSPAAKLVNQVGFHIFPVTGIVREQKPRSFYTDVMDCGICGNTPQVKSDLGKGRAKIQFQTSQGMNGKTGVP